MGGALQGALTGDWGQMPGAGAVRLGSQLDADYGTEVAARPVAEAVSRVERRSGGP